jgi:diguanylate cyclase (GGDEF)-like protein
MKLTRLFAIAMCTLALLVVSMLGRILQGEWQDYQDSRQGLRGLEMVRKAMVVMEKMSVERGPANTMLGEEAPQDAAARQALAEARLRSDEAMASLRGDIAVSTRPQPGVLPTLDKAQAALDKARANLDRVTALPLAERKRMTIRLALIQMFNVIPIVMDVENLLSHQAEESYHQLPATLASARFAVYLREDAGRLGSAFTSALATHQPLSEADQAGIDALRIRIDQLLPLIEVPVNNPGADPRVLAALGALRSEFFGKGMAFVAEVQRRGKDNVEDGLTAARFAAVYVPAMDAILHLRDTLMTVTMEQVAEAQRHARRELILACITGALILLLMAGLFFVISQRIVRPLLFATRTLGAIARGDLDTEVPLSPRVDEIGDMLRAVRLLRASSLEKRQLERERQGLIDDLRRNSDTDYLTGILNRRAFNDACNERGRRAREHNLPLALIMFDVDHFKDVNDRYGHEAGDHVLVRLAELVKDELREGEVLARYGGEEFIVLPVNCSLEAAQGMAERLRAAIENAVIVLPDRRTLRVTASFGVAQASGPMEALDQLLRAADTALYQAKKAGRNRVVSAEGAPAALPA